MALEGEGPAAKSQENTVFISYAREDFEQAVRLYEDLKDAGELKDAREFRLYLARGYIRISSAKQNNFYKIKYLFLSLDSYNKFLVRITKFGIKNIDKIYSDIMHNDATKNDELIKSINERLGGQGMDLVHIYQKSIKLQTRNSFLLENHYCKN